MELAPVSPVERVRRWLTRVALAGSATLLIVGLAIYASSGASQAQNLFHMAFFLLVAVPLVSVAAVLLEEIRGRDWPFVGAALLVVALVTYAIVRKL